MYLPVLIYGLSACLSALLLCRYTMSVATLIKESIQLGLAQSFRGFIHYHHGWKHGTKNREFCIQILRYQEGRERPWAWLGHLKPQSLLPLVYFLWQGHTPNPLKQCRSLLGFKNMNQWWSFLFKPTPPPNVHTSHWEKDSDLADTVLGRKVAEKSWFVHSDEDP